MFAAAKRTVPTAVAVVAAIAVAASATAGGAPKRDREAPTTPANLAVVRATDSLVEISWDASQDNVGVVGYDVLNETQRTRVSGTTYVVRDLACGSSAAVAVAAVDAARNASPRVWLTVSTAACVDRQPPSTPSGFVQAATTQDSVVLRWSPSTDNVGVVSYRVYRGLVAVSESVEPSTTVNGLACGSTYAFLADAADAAGNRSGLATVYVQTAPCSPTGDATPPAKPILSLGPITQTSAVLTWKAGVDNVGVHHYNVWLDSKIVAQTTSLSYTYDGLTCGTSYTLGLEVVDAAGNKSPLDQARWTIQAQACSPTGDGSAPSAPDNLLVTAAQPSRVSLGWSPARDNVGVVGYGVYENTNNVLVASQTTATVTGLACGTAYSFAVDARDAAGNRSPKASVVGATAACSDSRAPSAPSSLVATSRSATSIAISWAPSSDEVGVAGYGLYRDGTRVDSTTQPTAIFSGLGCNRNYTLGVDAYDAAGNRSGQAVVMVSTTACPDTQPPTAPSGLAASSVTQTSLALTWSVSSDNVAVTGYDVYKNGVKVATQTTTSIAVSGLACGTSYAFGVVARDAAGNASAQAQLSASTAACATAPPPPSQPPASTQPLFDGGFDTGDTSQWSYVHRYATDRFRVVSSDAGVSPRQGSHMARVEVRPNEGASWDSTMNVSMVQKGAVAGASGAGDDVYTGFSLYLPSGFSYVPNQLANNIMEWHGNSSTLQAPVHFAIDGYTGKFAVDLHTQSGWNPVSFSLGNVVRGRWVDFVIHTKWARDGSGIIEGWMDGQKVFSSSRQTWYSSGVDSVYPMLGYYRANYSQTSVFYVDAFKVGTSYQSVAP